MHALIAAALVVASARTARAQRPLGVGDLHGRVSASLEARLRALADSATVAHLPVAPLVDKALEGASKHAPDDRIVSAVHTVFTNLGIARHVLGDASDAELAAGAAALRAGVAPDALADARQRLARRSLTVPLSVLGSLVAAGVPPTDALHAVIDRAAHADDATMLAFGREIERSIAAGVPAPSAISVATGGTTPSHGPIPVALPPSTRQKP